MMRWLAVTFALLVLPAWPAETLQQQMQRVQSALGQLSVEQQAVFQQFQMVQELRRNEERVALQRLPIYRLTTALAPQNVDDVQREEEARAQRLNELQAEGDRLYARYRELEEQKRPLLETLASLAQAPSIPETPTGAAGPALTPTPPFPPQSPGFTGRFPEFGPPPPGFSPTPPRQLQPPPPVPAPSPGR
jgi:hypothetical protein